MLIAKPNHCLLLSNTMIELRFKHPRKKKSGCIPQLGYPEGHQYSFIDAIHGEYLRIDQANCLASQSGAIEPKQCFDCFSSIITVFVQNVKGVLKKQVFLPAI